MAEKVFHQGFEIGPLQTSGEDKSESVFLKLWASIPEENLWLTDETVDLVEARTGPCWMCRSAPALRAPIRFEEALRELAKLHSFRAGMLSLSCGGRIYFNLSDLPAYTVRSITLPLDGEVLEPAYTCEILE